MPGPTFNSSCEVECAGGTFESFDYAEVDGNDVDRNQICRCCNDEGPCQDPNTLVSKWECWSSNKVWDKAEEIKTCDKYNISSATTCIDFCVEKIDPKDYSWDQTTNKMICTCVGVDICDGNEELGINASDSRALMIISSGTLSVLTVLLLL